jgi:hypothetical protein
MSEIKRLIAEIESISTLDDEEQLKLLETAMERFFAFPEVGKHLQVLFRLFERFPEDDACEMFWTILHGIEEQPNCERLVVQSVRRRPSRFSVLMVNRMLNAGQTHVGRINLLKLLERVASDKSCPASVREDAQGFAAHQRGHV